jgi:hypothetical protein
MSPKFPAVISDEVIKVLQKIGFRFKRQSGSSHYYMKYRRENVGTAEERIVYLWKEGIKDSNWLRFQEAVKFNQKLAESILAPLITKLEFPVKL